MCIIKCNMRCIMRTNIVLDDSLVQEAFRYAQVSSRRELIDVALREFVANHRRRNIQELKGKIKFREDYDYKALRNDDEIH